MLDNVINIVRVLLVVIIVGILFENKNMDSSYEEDENNYIEFEEEMLVSDEMDTPEYITEEELFSIELYFINNGYYYHENKNCKGLEGYKNLNITYYDELLDYPNLRACNWCIKKISN